MGIKAAFICFIFAFGLSAFAADGHQSGTSLVGDYSNVVYIEEAGDDLGYDLKVRLDPQPRVYFQDCEGSCHGGVWIAAQRDEIGRAHV